MPEAFLPERWLPGWTTLGAAYVHNNAAFMPFSSGPMSCAGKGLAMQEMRMVICALLQSFTLRPRDGWVLSKYESAFRDYFSTVRGNLPITLEIRAESRT